MKKSENNNYSKFNRNFEKSEKSLKESYKFEINTIKINWTYVLPALLALFCYINGLSGDLVHDDIFAIKSNPDVHGKTDLWELFQNDFWGKSMRSNTSHKSYRPLTVLTFRLNYYYHGLEPLYYHVINVALHVVVTTLFVYLCRHVLRQEQKCSMLAGLLFAVHPIHTEAVTGVVGRAEVLAALFYLMSFILYERCINGSDVRRQVMGYVTSLSFAASAMLCKETGVTVLGVAVIYDTVETWNKRRMCQSGLHFSRYIMRLFLTFLFTIVLLGFRLWIMGGTLPTFTRADNPASFEDSFLTRLYTYGYLVTLNFWRMLAPMTLCYDWQHGSIPLVETITDLRNLATLSLVVFVVLTMISLLLQLEKKSSLTLFMSMVFTVVPFLPASNLFFPVGFVLAERVLYIPSMGVCVCVSLSFHRLHTLCRHYRSHVTLLLVLVLAMMSLKTWNQNKIWQSREILFKSGLAVLPHNAKVHYNYANFLKDSNRFDEARFHYSETLRLDNTYASAHNNLGTILEDSDEAEYHYRETLKLKPSHQSAHVNLGNLLFKRGLRDEGIWYMYKAVEIDYRNPEALTSMAWCLMEIGNLTDAENYLKKALEYSPDFFEAYTHYAVLMDKSGRHEESAKYYKKAYELDTSQRVLLVHAAQSYRSTGNIKEAEMLLQRALDMRRDVSTLEQLAVLYYNSGRTRESMSLYEDIERMNENSTDTVVRYAKILASHGDMEKAEEILTRTFVNNDNDLEFLTTLAKVKSNLEKHHEATELLSRALMLAAASPDEVDVEEMLYHKANSHKDLKDYQKALLDYEAVLRINPKHSSAHSNCGAIYHVNGSIEKARYHYQRAQELDPDNNIVRQNMEKLERLQIQRDLGIG